MIISATLIGGLINAHIFLLDSGLSLPVALLISSLAALFIIALLIAMIGWRLRQLRRIPEAVFGASPLASRARDTLDAFTTGLMED